jgi:predicted dithiol-disulfide oxidoreductase (DUF899 family)
MAGAKRQSRTRFPGETPEYRAARERLLQSEIQLRRNIESVAAERRKLPLGGEIPEDYVFKAWSPKTNAMTSIRFSELFAPRKNTLFLYNFMFPESPDSNTPCPSCTSIIDAVDGAAPHLVQRINFVVVAKAPIAKFRDHARRRGWQHALLLSSAGNSFNRDYHAEDPSGQQFPIAHVFVRRRGKIHHFWSSELWWAKADAGQDLRHVDFMWPLWHILDTTPEGRGERWGPSLKYR